MLVFLHLKVMYDDQNWNKCQFLKTADPPNEFIPGWKTNDLKSWHHILYEDFVDYLLFSKAYDGKEVKSFWSLRWQNYVNSRWLWDIQSITFEQNVFLKTKVSPSQHGVRGEDDHDGC